MGEVYRARDERLERDVALKVMLAESSADPDLQRRFALEARAASALNHPNLLTIHDVGRDGGVLYIVSELVEGEQLRAIMARGPIPLRKILDIGIQVAAGLAAAHHAGIVHRDMKPANVMVTREGMVKILDFGLAKKVEKKAADQGVTAPGLIVGTATYMSPEQVQGEDIDHRSDQFSFGLVLYEMVTGKPAFTRGSAVGTMTAIVEEQAKPIAEMQPNVPVPLRWCIERCMAKDREERYTSTSDLHRELQTIRNRLEELSSSQVAAMGIPHHHKKWKLWPVLLGVVGLLTGWIVTESLLIPDATVDMRRYHVRPLISSGANEGWPAWAADGKSIAYSASVNGVRQIFVRDLSSPMSTQVTSSTMDSERPFWSPDDSRIFYLTAGSGGTDLWSVGATGGSQTIVQQNASAATISPDGKTLAYLRADAMGKDPLSLWLLPVGGGTPKQYTAGPFASNRYQFGYLAFAPDGKAIGAWLSRPDGGSEFWVLPYPEGAPREPFSFILGTYPFSWMPDSRNVVFGGMVPGSVGADLQMVDTRQGRLRPVSMLTRDAIQATVSPDGKTVAFNAAEDDFDLMSVPLDGSPVRRLLATPRNELDPVWSPSGDQLAFTTDRTGTSQIWWKSLREGWERPLVTERDFGQSWVASFGEPNFSPDGRRIAYSVASSSGHSVYLSSVAGGKPIRLSRDSNDEQSPTWNGDGSWVAYLKNANGGWALVKAQSGGDSPSVLLREGCLPSHPKWDRHTGRGVAVMTAEGLTLVSEDGKSSRILSKSRWLVFGWSHDAKLLYGITQSADRRRMIASVDAETGTEKVIGELQLPAASEVRGFSLAPDGQGFATSASRPSGAIWTLEGFQRAGLWK